MPPSWAPHPCPSAQQRHVGRSGDLHWAGPGCRSGVAWCHPLIVVLIVGTGDVPPLAPASLLLTATSMRPLRTPFTPLHLHSRVTEGPRHDGRQTIKESALPREESKAACLAHPRGPLFLLSPFAPWLLGHSLPAPPRPSPHPLANPGSSAGPRELAPLWWD